MLRPKEKILEEQEIRRAAEKIVSEAKRTAKYKQGTLFRSISYTFTRGILIFRQIFYGQYHENSQLEELAKKNVPKGVDYKIVLTDFDRSIISETPVKKGTKRNTNLLSGIITTSNIRNLINRNKAKRGKKEDKNTN